METPETNVKMAALKLLRHKILTELASSKFPSLSVEDVNEVLVVAGLPVVLPEEVNIKNLEVMSL